MFHVTTHECVQLTFVLEAFCGSSAEKIVRALGLKPVFGVFPLFACFVSHMAKAAPKAAPKARPLWCALQATTKQGYYSHLSLQVLCKSDKKCLRMISIPLRFVDSMNVFLTSLASMINNLRACARKQLPELFPLMASLRPKLQLRTPTDSPPQRRPFKQRRTH